MPLAYRFYHPFPGWVGMLANTMKNCGVKNAHGVEEVQHEEKNFPQQTDKRWQKHLTIFMWKMNDPFMALAVDQGCYLPS